jgi:hypothetical protein
MRKLAGNHEAGSTSVWRCVIARLTRALRVLPLAMLAGYAMAGANDPLEYVDDQTGASVTTVSKPLIFAHKRSETVNGPRDLVTLAAAAVDRSGKYTYVLVAYFWSVGVAEEPGSGTSACKPLALQLEDGRIDFTPREVAREEGIGVAVHKPPFGAKAPCIYATDLPVLRRMAAAPHPVLYSEGQDASLQYDLFEDRLNALKQLVERLKDTG